MREAMKQSQVGARKTKPVGSVDWCWQTTALAESTFACATDSLGRWERLLREIEQHRIWEKVPEDAPYGNRDAWARTHFKVNKYSELTPTYLQRYAEVAAAKEQPLATDDGDLNEEQLVNGIRTRLKGGEGVDIVNPRAALQGGNATEYTLRRLARDEHNDLLDAIKSGEMSVNQAAIKAGYRKKYTHAEKCVNAFRKAENRLEPLRVIVAELEQHERQVLADWLQE